MDIEIFFKQIKDAANNNRVATFNAELSFGKFFLTSLLTSLKLYK